MAKMKDAIERGEFIDDTDAGYIESVDAQMKRQAEQGDGDNFGYESQER